MTKKIYLKKPARLVFVLICSILLSIFLTLLLQAPASGNNIPEYITVTVSKGDTLWNIAKQYNTYNEDIREKIDEIKELNKISSNIRVGQELKIKIN